MKSNNAPICKFCGHGVRVHEPQCLICDCIPTKTHHRSSSIQERPLYNWITRYLACPGCGKHLKAYERKGITLYRIISSDPEPILHDIAFCKKYRKMRA